MKKKLLIALSLILCVSVFASSCSSDSGRRRSSKKRSSKKTERAYDDEDEDEDDDDGYVNTEKDTPTSEEVITEASTEQTYPLLDEPTNFLGTVSGNYRVIVWDPVPGAEGYVIQHLDENYGIRSNEFEVTTNYCLLPYYDGEASRIFVQPYYTVDGERVYTFCEQSYYDWTIEEDRYTNLQTCVLAYDKLLSWMDTKGYQPTTDAGELYYVTLILDDELNNSLSSSAGRVADDALNSGVDGFFDGLADFDNWYEASQESDSLWELICNVGDNALEDAEEEAFESALLSVGDEITTDYKIIWQWYYDDLNMAPLMLRVYIPKEGRPNFEQDAFGALQKNENGQYCCTTLDAQYYVFDVTSDGDYWVVEAQVLYFGYLE
ncbi:MAG: hypothetical protein J6U54_04185 [Clostridiales bacterium]|nr:hypothetical protein [Clostridiales bacterium]